jgi:hypothetical protein
VGTVGVGEGHQRERGGDAAHGPHPLAGSPTPHGPRPDPHTNDHGGSARAILDGGATTPVAAILAHLNNARSRCDDPGRHVCGEYPMIAAWAHVITTPAATDETVRWHLPRHPTRYAGWLDVDRTWPGAAGTRRRYGIQVFWTTGGERIRWSSDAGAFILAPGGESS